MDPGKRGNLFDQRQDAIVIETELALLSCRVDLDQDVHNPPGLYSFFADGSGQVCAVHAVDHNGLVHEVLDFVCLQVADHMPLNIFRQLRELVIDLLHTVFAERTLSGIVSLSEILDRHSLGDTDQSYVVTVSAGSLTSLSDTFFHTADIISNHLCSFILPIGHFPSKK